MADEDTSTDAPATEEAPDEQPEQAGLPDEVKAVLRKERQAAREASKRASEFEARLKDIENASKTDDERRSERLKELEGTATSLSTENARLRVALAKGLPLDLAMRLQGDDEKALEKDADQLLSLLQPATDRPSGFDGGARRPAPKPDDMNDRIRAALGRS